MVTTFKVTKYEGMPDNAPLELCEGLGWDAATTAAVRMGAIPGTGLVDALAFETDRAGVWVIIETEPGK